MTQEFSNASKRIALYGAGGFGQALYNQYEQSVSMWSDKNYLVYLEKGLPVTSINEMLDKQNQYDLVFIAILDEQLCKQIKDSLIEKGMKNKILFFSRDK